jgi:acylphosphatase
VDKIFLINGKKIFDIPFRPGLIQLADEAGIKTHATNLRDKNQVRVVKNGSHSSVQTFYRNVVKKTITAHLR